MTIRVNKLRIAPDGPFVGENGENPVTVGPGTPGIVYHAKPLTDQAMTGAVERVLWSNPSGAPPTLLLPWILRKNLFLEILLEMVFFLDPTPAGSIVTAINAVDPDLGEQQLATATWVLPDGFEEYPALFARMAIDTTGWTNDRDQVSVDLTLPATSTLDAEQTNFTITHYVP